MEENMNIPHGNEGKGLPVCVVGVGGYIGSWLVKTLLENGYTVHATLRDPHNPSKNSSLLSLSGAQERLRLFRADLCEEGSFDYAIHGCHGVFHVATPTDFGSQDPEREVIETAVRGTLNVLKSCLATKSVRRVVYTSSASVASFPEKPVKIIDESCWSSVDLIRQNKPPGWMYYVSKTLADQAALQFAKENKMEVFSIVPVTVVGPWLTTTIPSSVDVTMSLITGMGATLNACKPKKGSIVAVFGLGVVGLAACEGARIAGAARIIGIDFNNERYERAKQFGVTEFINPKEYEKPIQQVIAEKTDGGVDCSVECTGSIEAMVQALECCHDGWGVAVLTGVPRSDAVFKTNPVNFLSKKTLKGAFFGNYKPRTDLPGLVEMYLNRELELDKFVTDKVSFDDINKAFDHMLKGEGLRTVIKFIQD